MNLNIKKDIELIIWDWNGTLLNDVDYCVTCINDVLTKYGYKNISVEKYREIFTFPIKDYYRRLGFDFSKHSFEQVGKEFIDLYNENLHKTSLQPNSLDVIKHFSKLDKKQIVISAREHNSLIEDLKNFGLFEYFDYAHGISNIYGESKMNLFENYLENNKISVSKVLLIGDTTHDFDIASKLGLNFIQLSAGHQDASHFEKDSIVFVENLEELTQ